MSLGLRHSEDMLATIQILTSVMASFLVWVNFDFSGAGFSGGFSGGLKTSSFTLLSAQEDCNLLVYLEGLRGESMSF